MIKVDKVCVEKLSDSVRIYCDYYCNDYSYSKRLWFDISHEYSKYLSTECGDAFFIILVLLAHDKGQDISFETLVSERLYYGVTEILLPALRIVNPNKPVIKVSAKTADFHYKAMAVGTALSLGVDSFHAVVDSLDSCFPVTHLTLFNSGAFGDENPHTARQLFWKTVDSVSEAAHEMGLPLISIDSNMNEVLKMCFVQTHSFRNLSFAFLLPHLFKVFYYASGFPASQFQLKNSASAAQYDLLTAKALSSESLEIIIAGLHEDRNNKIMTISSFAPSTKYLNVCVIADSNKFLSYTDNQVRNCSRCFKCVKTVVAMDALGVLDKYSHVFDLEIYKQERASYLGWVLYDAKKLKSSHALEIIREGQMVPGFFPLKAYKYAFSKGSKNLMRKLQNRRKSKKSS